MHCTFSILHYAEKTLQLRNRARVLLSPKLAFRTSIEGQGPQTTKISKRQKHPGSPNPDRLHLYALPRPHTHQHLQTPSTPGREAANPHHRSNKTSPEQKNQNPTTRPPPRRRCLQNTRGGKMGGQRATPTTKGPPALFQPLPLRLISAPKSFPGPGRAHTKISWQTKGPPAQPGAPTGGWGGPRRRSAVPPSRPSSTPSPGSRSEPPAVTHGTHRRAGGAERRQPHGGDHPPGGHPVSPSAPPLPSLTASLPPTSLRSRAAHPAARTPGRRQPIRAHGSRFPSQSRRAGGGKGVAGHDGAGRRGAGANRHHNHWRGGPIKSQERLRRACEPSTSSGGRNRNCRRPAPQPTNERSEKGSTEGREAGGTS